MFAGLTKASRSLQCIVSSCHCRLFSISLQGYNMTLLLTNLVLLAVEIIIHLLMVFNIVYNHGRAVLLSYIMLLNRVCYFCFNFLSV